MSSLVQKKKSYTSICLLNSTPVQVIRETRVSYTGFLITLATVPSKFLFLHIEHGVTLQWSSLLPFHASSYQVNGHWCYIGSINLDFFLIHSCFPRPTIFKNFYCVLGLLVALLMITFLQIKSHSLMWSVKKAHKIVLTGLNDLC